MKILIVCAYGVVYDDNSNPFVNCLAEGLKKDGHEVVCGLDAFWQNFYDYDVLYFQWPEALFNGYNKSLSQLETQLDKIKAAKVKMVVTCHNLHPHSNDSFMTKVYELLYSKVDAFHHMGNNSYDLLKKRYPDKYHFIAPHHTPEGFYDFNVNHEEAKRTLNIPESHTVVASFGAFRNKAEVEMFMQMAKDVGKRDITYLAPRLPYGRIYNGKHIGKMIENLKLYHKYKSLGVRRAGFLGRDELSFWVAASDVVFIQRKEILNSGNIPLAFAAGKIVVGPNMGNVGDIIQRTNNFSFEPGEKESIKRAVEDSIKAVREGRGVGEANLIYSKEHWNLNTIIKTIVLHLNILKTLN